MCWHLGESTALATPQCWRRPPHTDRYRAITPPFADPHPIGPSVLSPVAIRHGPKVARWLSTTCMSPSASGAFADGVKQIGG